ncbi:hypothetical protein Efla_001584 [Eimeria flavescens]
MDSVEQSDSSESEDEDPEEDAWLPLLWIPPSLVRGPLLLPRGSAAAAAAESPEALLQHMRRLLEVALGGWQRLNFLLHRQPLRLADFAAFPPAAAAPAAGAAVVERRPRERQQAAERQESDEDSISTTDNTRQTTDEDPLCTCGHLQLALLSL